MSKTKQYEIKKFDKEQIERLRLAMNMVGVGVNEMATDLILQAQAAYGVMGGDFDLKTASRIIDEKYNPKTEPPQQ